MVFGGEGLALDPINSLQTLFKPFLFLSHYVPQTRTRIALVKVVSPNSSSKEEPRHFLTCHYITASIHEYQLCQLACGVCQVIQWFNILYNYCTMNANLYSLWILTSQAIPILTQKYQGYNLIDCCRLTAITVLSMHGVEIDSNSLVCACELYLYLYGNNNTMLLGVSITRSRAN